MTPTQLIVRGVVLFVVALLSTRPQGGDMGPVGYRTGERANPRVDARRVPPTHRPSTASTEISSLTNLPSPSIDSGVPLAALPISWDAPAYTSSARQSPGHAND